jgi:hypothetical protein
MGPGKGKQSGRLAERSDKASRNENMVQALHSLQALLRPFMQGDANEHAKTVDPRVLLND